MLLDDALRALPVVDGQPGDVIDVGSGGGTPGVPLAASRPERAFTLLEAERRKCGFLERVTAELDNVTVRWGRAEEQPVDTFGVALAKALAKPPVAAELCLPLVTPGGVAILWLAESADRGPVATVAEAVAARLEDDLDGLVVLRKLRETPPGFPRRPGVAKKRPLA
jgi:16S rRNA (guanine527-N7)-methyltransferase